MTFFRNAGMIWRVGLYEMKVILLSFKFFVLSLLSWMFMELFVRSIREFALDYGETLVPAELPFYFSDTIYCNIAFLLLIFLFSDIPLKDHSQRQVLQRSGLACYGLGHMMAISLVTVVYVAEQLLLSVLVCLPCIEFGDWGKIWQSVAAGDFLELGYDSYVMVSQDVISNYQPWQAILISACLFCLTGICYGMMEYLLNGISNGKLGTAVLSAWSLIWILFQNMWVGVIPELNRISPQSWNDLQGKKAGDIMQTGMTILICIVVLLSVIMVLIKRRKVEIA